MQLATWNVNSLKVRLNHVLDWLDQTKCEVLGIQELKLDNQANLALVDAFAERGYHYIYNGQKTYNGVGIISKFECEDIVYDIPNYDDPQKRLIAATINGVRVICAYFVNGESVGSDKYTYKLEWLVCLQEFVARELMDHSQLALIGDYNIAPEDRDTYDPALWKDQVLCTTLERNAFWQLIDLGLVDSFRYFNSEGRQYTWWDYRNMAFRRKQGMRIDHILITPELLTKAKGCVIDTEPRKLERPSDHTPIMLSLNLGGHYAR